MSDPDWKVELMNLAGRLDQYGDAVYTAGLLMPHIEAAYQRGLAAGRRTNTKDDICPSCLSPLTDAPSAETPSPASSTEAGEP